MKTLKVSINSEEEEQVYQNLIKLFDEQSSVLYAAGQEIEFDFKKSDIGEDIKVYSFLSIYRESGELNENHQGTNPPQYPDMNSFILDFCIDGEEIEVVRNQVVGKCIEDRIQNYFTK